MAWVSVVDGRAEDSIFEKGSDGKRDRQVCARSVWYQKWKHDPLITVALEECRKALRAWKDNEVARAETAALKRVRLALAGNAEQAIAGGLQGIIEDRSVAGNHRLQAIDRYIQLFSPELSQRIQEEGSAPAEQNPLAGLSDEQLTRLIENLSRAPGNSAAGEAETPE
jgi:hypothetical protein